MLNVASASVSSASCTHGSGRGSTASAVSRIASARALVVISILTWALFPGVLSAQVAQKVIATTDLNGPVDVATADLDGDGDQDMLSTSANDDKIVWYPNHVGESETDADGFGSQRVITASANSPSAVVAADLDGDGDQDVVSASKRGDKILWYENQIGEGDADSDGFGDEKTISTNVDRPTSVFAADLNGDGRLDVLSASGRSPDGGKIAWYENEVGDIVSDSDGFGPQQTITQNADGPTSVVAEDLDGDGDSDVLFSASSPTDDHIAWYANQHGESGADADGFGSEHIIAADTSPSSVVASDMDGDGDPDVLSASSDEDNLTWYKNQVGDSGADSDGFGSSQIISFRANGPTSVFARDLDGDGDQDALYTSTFDHKIVWHENQSGESDTDDDGFGREQIITTDAKGARAVFASDIDGDGAEDVLSASFEDDKLAWYRNEIGASSADSDGFGSQQEATVPGASGAKAIVTADLDGDGDDDVLSAASGDNAVAWYENETGESGADSDGFGPQKRVASDAGDATSVFAADVDGDGDPDVLSASPADGTVAWYENRVGESEADADGFGPEKALTTDADRPTSVVAADLDGDGDPDVVSAFAGIDNVASTGAIAWFENKVGNPGADADGFGNQQTIIADVDGAQSVYAADLDGDRDPDVLSALDEFANIVWSENQIEESGADGFGEYQVIDSGFEEGTFVRSVRVDSDDNFDVLALLGNSGKIVLHKNESGESGADSDGFGDRQIIASDPAAPASSIFASDLDADGDQDLLTTSGRKINWHENEHGETGADSDGFGAEQLINANTRSPESVFAADLDRDGDQDVLSASSGDDKIAWYPNTGGVLPVEFAKIEARVRHETVHLQWRTASETNNAGFEIQRTTKSGGTSSWTRIGFVDGSGTTSEPHSYRFTDGNIPFGAKTVHYRVRQIDTDGASHLSREVTVELGTPERLTLHAPFPNPASSQATLRFGLPGTTEVRLGVYDVLGRQVALLARGEQTAGRKVVTIDTESLPSGTYFLRLQTREQTWTRQLTVVR